MYGVPEFEIVETPEYMRYWIKTILEQNSAIIAQNLMLLRSVTSLPQAIVKNPEGGYPPSGDEPVKEKE